MLTFFNYLTDILKHLRNIFKHLSKILTFNIFCFFYFYPPGYPQAIQGLCGGFPGRCFPALKAKPDQTRLQLTLIPSHPCLQP